VRTRRDEHTPAAPDSRGCAGLGGRGTCRARDPSKRSPARVSCGP
jgi:hypothetical protein